jgi:hypothetical protein
MKNKRMKKSLSIVLTLVLLLSLFCGVTQGPEATAITESQVNAMRIGLKSVSFHFDNAAESYDEIDNTKIYNDDPVCLVVKKTGGKVRLPKGCYIRVYYENDYIEFTEDGLSPLKAEKNGYKARYTGGKIAKDTNQTSWYWPKPWKTGNYRVCLFIPFTDGSEKLVTWATWKKKIYRYG